MFYILQYNFILINSRTTVQSFIRSVFLVNTQFHYNYEEPAPKEKLRIMSVISLESLAYFLGHPEKLEIRKVNVPRGLGLVTLEPQDFLTIRSLRDIISLILVKNENMLETVGLIL
jgi:hypothetical protein